MMLRLFGLAGATALLVGALPLSSLAKKPPKDRGEASMKIGAESWSAKRASARTREDRLTISATWSEHVEGVRVSQTVRLVVKGYTGPGEYKATASSSFTKVGVNMETLKKAEGNDEATTKAVTDLLRKSEVVLLRDAKVVITSADAKEIHGTFSKPRAATGPAVTEGRFRALVKKKRARSRKRLRRGATKPE